MGRCELIEVAVVRCWGALVAGRGGGGRVGRGYACGMNCCACGGGGRTEATLSPLEDQRPHPGAAAGGAKGRGGGATDEVQYHLTGKPLTLNRIDSWTAGVWWVEKGRGGTGGGQAVAYGYPFGYRRNVRLSLVLVLQYVISEHPRGFHCLLGALSLRGKLSLEGKSLLLLLLLL